MTKYYKAKVELRQIVEIEVASENESDARRRAKEAALQQVPGADVWTIELSLQCETHFEVGSRINHAQFGPGEIQELTRTSGPDNYRGFRATVLFDDGKKVDLGLPHPTVKPEVFGA